LNERDQKALKLIALFSPALIYLVLVQPLFSYYQSSRSEFQEAQGLLAWMEANKHRIQPQGATNNSQISNTDAVQRLSAAAENAGIAIDRLQPQGNKGVQVWFQSVDFAKLSQWLLTLQQQGLVVESLSLDSTAKPGMVSAQCLIGQGT
jgi:general secretion pathway protein M